MQTTEGRARASTQEFKNKKRINLHRIPEIRMHEQADGGQYAWVIIPTAVTI
jgi:hypothetical protein